jgi:hypothetical protein
VAPVPTGPVPVAPQVGRLAGHNHHVTGPGSDLLLAAGTEVGLGGLERLQEPHLELVALVVGLRSDHGQRLPSAFHE